MRNADLRSACDRERRASKRPWLVRSRHRSLEVAGAYAVVPYLTFTLGEPIGGWIADRLVAIGWDEIIVVLLAAIPIYWLRVKEPDRG